MPTDTPDPNAARYRKAWARMDRSDRRRVMRAVNRMQALEEPAEAALAIRFAQRQRRMWVRWWWVLPLLNGAVAYPRGWTAVGVNVLIGALLVGIFAAAFAWRAGRSLQLNREVLEAAQRRRRSGSPKQRAAGKPKGGARRARGRRR